MCQENHYCRQLANGPLETHGNLAILTDVKSPQPSSICHSGEAPPSTESSSGLQMTWAEKWDVIFRLQKAFARHSTRSAPNPSTRSGHTTKLKPLRPGQRQSSRPRQSLCCEDQSTDQTSTSLQPMACENFGHILYI